MNPMQIFEKHPHMDAYRVGGFYSPYALVATEKRFTEAELAAEWHANDSAAWRMFARRPEFYDLDFAEKLEERDSTLRRFARLPHAHESDYQ